MRIEWSARAVLDLKAISEHLEQDRNQETANRVTRTIYDAVQSLRTMPRRGREGRVDSTRELVVQRLPCIVVYGLVGERILILNIVHGAQRWP
jgi:plasmid stabilization system protein ParE